MVRSSFVFFFLLNIKAHFVELGDVRHNSFFSPLPRIINVAKQLPTYLWSARFAEFASLGTGIGDVLMR